MFPEKLVALFVEAYERDFTAAMPGVEALSEEDRKQQLEAAERELLERERHEEFLVERLIGDGNFRISRRADASPLAVLGVQVATDSMPRAKLATVEVEEHETVERAKLESRAVAVIRGIYQPAS